MKIEQMTSNRSGRPVANQFIIIADNGDTFFQSYQTVIAKKSNNAVTLDPKWDYSVTTGKYRNEFLGEKKKDTERKIKSGEYTIEDLNK